MLNFNLTGQVWGLHQGNRVGLKAEKGLGGPPHQASSSLQQPPGKGLAHCIAVAGCGTLVFDAGTEVGRGWRTCGIKFGWLWEKAWMAWVHLPQNA